VSPVRVVPSLGGAAGHCRFRLAGVYTEAVMPSFRIPQIAVTALACALAAAAPMSAHAQGFVQQVTPDADELAANMRLLAANPRDVTAMARAGELTLKLGDPTAAAGFFARAERIDPSNPRIKAGKGSLLVQSGRPGEALLQFAQAEQLRGDVRRFAADRGLAYDLIGEQERAQRDYRLALRDGPADETLRRYALSLGISGKREEALAVIDPLLRRSDRAAWRSRAFILAMTGDAAGATKIATSMMPGGMAQGLQPFFDRLPQLGAVDRAFAVHFGEVRASPQRLADARLAPRLPALAPEPGRAPAVVLAAVQPLSKAERKKERRRGKRDKIEMASTPPPVPLPQPPAYQGTAVASVRPLPAPVYVQQVRRPVDVPAQPARTLPPVTLASTRPVAPAMTMSTMPVRPAAETNTRVVAEAPPRMASDAPIRAVPPTSSASAVVTPRPVVVEPRPTPAPAPVPIQVAAVPPTVVPSPAPTPAPAALQTAPADVPARQASAGLTWAVPVRSAAVSPAAEASTPGNEPAPQPIRSVSAAAVTPPSPPLTAPSATLPPASGPARGEDSILAKIIANITVPGSELDVAPVNPAPAPIETAAAVATDPAPVVETPVAGRREPARADAPEATPRAADARQNDKAVADRKLADKKLADKKVADAKTLADAKKADTKKGADTKKAAEAKKLADAKKAEELKKKDPKLLEPARIWVQVAGGANQGDLAKEWTRVKNKAPAAFKGKSGWTTPLRATNRVLAGPFKTDGEARAFVNALTKEGLSGFSFTSEAGQKVSRLGAK
jgi:Flp pilus assembly protein TadD